MLKHNGPKILILDIETAPNLASVWGLWQEVTSTEMFEKEWYILCWSAKWLDEKKVICDALPDHKLQYFANKENDKAILETLWKLMDEADIIVAHNGVDFDLKKINARFIKHGMKPPSPYKVVDTKIVAKKYFGFTSNKLNDIGKYLNLGVKVETGGFKLWRECLAGNMKAWQRMKTYNVGDIILLEKIYLAMLPYMSNHPKCGNYIDSDEARCTNCGSPKLQKRGVAFSGSGKYHRLQCTECGAWMRLGQSLHSKTKVKVSCL